MTTRESLKQEIDKLNDEQLEQVAAFIERQIQPNSSPIPLWRSATPAERANYFRAWVSQLPKRSPSLPLEAIGRDRIYDE